jgi:hypothetical protein
MGSNSGTPTPVPRPHTTEDIVLFLSQVLGPGKLGNRDFPKKTISQANTQKGTKPQKLSSGRQENKYPPAGKTRQFSALKSPR